MVRTIDVAWRIDREGSPQRRRRTFLSDFTGTMCRRNILSKKACEGMEGRKGEAAAQLEMALSANLGH